MDHWTGRWLAIFHGNCQIKLNCQVSQHRKYGEILICSFIIQAKVYPTMEGMLAPTKMSSLLLQWYLPAKHSPTKWLSYWIATEAKIVLVETSSPQPWMQFKVFTWATMTDMLWLLWHHHWNSWILCMYAINEIWCQFQTNRLLNFKISLDQFFFWLYITLKPDLLVNQQLLAVPCTNPVGGGWP